MIDIAIKKINPNAQFIIINDDINQITWINGTTPISQSDIEAMIPTIQQEIIDQKTQEQANKQSALNKLKTLGLTDDEITALIG